MISIPLIHQLHGWPQLTTGFISRKVSPPFEKALVSFRHRRLESVAALGLGPLSAAQKLLGTQMMTSTFA